MLKIIINGIIADLKGASKQELVFQNPIWDYEAMVSTYGLPFSLPFCKTNDRIFGNARSEFSEAMAPNYLCEQYFNDDLITEGLIQLIDTNGAYNCNFISNIRDIFTPVGAGTVRYDGFLRDILPAGPSVSPVANRNAMTTWNGIVCYPTITNPQFYTANAPGGWNNQVNSYTASTYQNTTFVPAVGVDYILSQIASYYGITIVGDFVTDAVLDRLVVFTNSAEDGSVTANLKLAVGDISPSQFINELRNIFGLTGDIDVLNKKITLNFAYKYFDANITADWSNICSKIISKNTAPFAGIEVDYVADSNDNAYKTSSLFPKYATAPPSSIGSDSIKNRLIKSNISPTALTGANFPATMSQAGRTSVNSQNTNPISIRIGIFREIVVSLPQIDTQDAGLVYKLRNDSGNNRRHIKLFRAEETFWKNTFEATFRINLRKLSLSSFDIKNKVHIHGWNYLIKRIVMDCNNPENSLLEAYRA